MPPGKLKEFEAKTRGMSKVVMHENLGAAIDEEVTVESTYAGE